MGKNQKDAVESFCFWGHPKEFKMPVGSSPHLIPFQEAASNLWETYCELLKTIHKIAARSLGIDEEYFNERYFDKEDNGKECANGLTLKISFYPNVESCVSEDGFQPLRYGEHTDYQGFTILKPDCNDWSTPDQGGLEVQDKVTGLWEPVKISQSDQGSAVVVNAGDLITHWTNSKWHSPVHRVRGPVNTLSSGSSVECNRVSIIFFSGP
jgi:isopenicillin N synthase-like dioxygenase